MSTAPATACLALADGTLFYGRGFGATGLTTAELCFNTAMTGYQEIMTDPSYAGQIVTFTFPHIGGKMKIKKNRELIRNFALSVSELNPSRVLVTLCGGQGGTEYDSVQREECNHWQVVKMMAHGGFVLVNAQR